MRYLLIIFICLLCGVSYGQKSGFTLEQLQGNPQDVESICFADGLDTLDGWKIHTYDIIEGYGFTIVDADGVERPNANEIPSYYCTPQSEIITECICDDVLGDTTNVVSFTAAYKRTCFRSDVITEFIGYYTDDLMTTEYVPSNIIDCNIGEDAVFVWRRRVLETGTWTAPATVTSLSYSVISEGNGVTLADDLNTLPLYETESGAWANEGFVPLSNTLTFTADNSRVVIIYKEIQ